MNVVHAIMLYGPAIVVGVGVVMVMVMVMMMVVVVVPVCGVYSGLRTERSAGRLWLTYDDDDNGIS